MENIPLTALIVLILCSASCAIIGNFVLWKRLSFFGDATAHSALFGVAIGTFLKTDQIITLVIFNLLFSFITYIISKQKSYAIDGMVMIVAYFFIACAILFNNSFNKGFELEEFIFPDILQATQYHVAIIAILGCVIALFAIFFWQKFLVAIMNPDIARVKNINSDLINFYFMSLLSLLIAFAINVTGIFLVTALMIVPCVISRIFSKNPPQMIVNSTLISIIISGSSFYCATSLSMSPAPLIIFIQCSLFFILLILKNIFKTRRYVSN